MVSNNYYLRPSLLVSKILDCLEVLVNIQPFFDSLHSLTAATMQSLSRPHLLTQRKWPLTQGLAPETGVSNKIVELCLTDVDARTSTQMYFNFTAQSGGMRSCSTQANF